MTDKIIQELKGFKNDVSELRDTSSKDFRATTKDRNQRLNRQFKNQESELKRNLENKDNDKEEGNE